MSAPVRPCEVCGAAESRLFLRSARLDGPLCRCASCGHLAVGARLQDFTFASSDPGRSAALAAQVRALAIVDVAVEAAEAAPLRDLVQRERLARLSGHVARGRLLDVGAALGDFVAVAGERFRAEGVEPDPHTAAQARARGLNVRTGTLEEVARLEPGYDVITMFHLLEHLDSPRAGLSQARELLSERGILTIETPTADSAFFLLAPARWRQLIPDHYHFFSRVNLCRLLTETGFEILSHTKVSRRVSLRFAADRARRASLPGAGALGKALSACSLENRSLRVTPGDIMEITARAR